MRRWIVVIFVFVIIVAAILGGVLQLVVSLFPELQQQTVLPFIVATAVTGVLANVLIAVMQWFGVSPLDYLPERTLRDSLRKQDPYRFALTKSKDPKFLSEQAKAAKNQKQYDWMSIFAEAWMHLRPTDADAYEALGEALNELNKYNEAIEIGDKLTKLEPLNHEGYTILGDAYFELGEREKARRWYEEALKVVAPNFRQFVLIDLIKTYESLGLVDEAVKTLEEALPLLDGNLNSYYTEKWKHLSQVKTKSKSP